MTPFSYDSFQEMEFVPMMWSSFPGDKDQIAVFPKMGYKSVLAFNEPDREDQANLDVDTAVEGMKAFQNKGIRVGAPATSLCPPWSDNWFVPFYEEDGRTEHGCGFYTNTSLLETGMQMKGHRHFSTLLMKHGKCTISLFGLLNLPLVEIRVKTKFQRKVVMRYMKKVIAGLDKKDYVETLRVVLV